MTINIKIAGNISVSMTLWEGQEWGTPVIGISYTPLFTKVEAKRNKKVLWKKTWEHYDVRRSDLIMAYLKRKGLKEANIKKLW